MDDIRTGLGVWDWEKNRWDLYEEDERNRL